MLANSVANIYCGASLGMFLQVCPSRGGDPGPYMFFGGPTIPPPRRHVDRFIRVCRAHAHDQQTRHTQTDHAATITAGHTICYTQRCGIIAMNITKKQKPVLLRKKRYRSKLRVESVLKQRRQSTVRKICDKGRF